MIKRDGSRGVCMNVIYTNDDGIDAPGIRALVGNVPPGVKAIVVAPANERSACSHSISLGQKLRIEEFTVNGIEHYKVHGTPADCIKFAVSELKYFSPDLVVSGVNQGANTGISVYYSGTISAAREAVINHIPAAAFSLCSRVIDDFGPSVKIAAQLMEGFAAKVFPSQSLVSVNIPPIPYHKIKGIKITKQAASRFVEEFVKEKEHDGKRVYSLAGEIELYDTDGTSDEEAVMNGYVSVTPLRLDVTDYQAIRYFEDWLKRV